MSLLGLLLEAKNVYFKWKFFFWRQCRGSGQLTSIKYLSHLGCNLFSVLHKNCLLVKFEGFPYMCQGLGRFFFLVIFVYHCMSYLNLNIPQKICFSFIKIMREAYKFNVLIYKFPLSSFMSLIISIDLFWPVLLMMSLAYSSLHHEHDFPREYRGCDGPGMYLRSCHDLWWLTTKIMAWKFQSV